MSLEVSGLCKTFRDQLTLKKKQVLFDVSFKVPTASVCGFLGSNGSGKTTTMKCLLGLLQKTKGEISFFDNQYKDPRRYIGYLPERPYFYEYLTGLEFLMYYGQLSTDKSKNDLKQHSLQLLEMVGIASARDKQLRSFSKGMLQRVGLAQAIIHQPKFLILDEPMSGLDPDGRYQMTQLITQIAQQGTTIFFSSHLLDDIEKLCQNIIIIDQGRIIYQGLLQEILKAKSSGYEIVSTRPLLSHPVVHRVNSLNEVSDYILGIKQEGGTLIEVKETRLSLQQAFNDLKNEMQI